MLRTSGRPVDMSTPFADAMMPDGSRLDVVIPEHHPLARGDWRPQVPATDGTLGELVALGTLDARVAGLLEVCGSLGAQPFSSPMARGQARPPATSRRDVSVVGSPCSDDRPP
jgi:hypothetical protein